MSKQYPGGIISKTAPVPSGPYETSTASGIWTLDQQAAYAKVGQWPTAGNQAPDAQFNYVTMLLHGDGTNGAQNNTFLDSSTNNFTITRNGNTTQGSFSPYGSNWSNFFNGTDATLTFPSSSNFAFGTGSFTIEFWINGPLNNDKFILGGRDAIGGMHITTGGSSSTAGVLRYVGTSTIVSSNVITDNTWHHCAIVRNGSSNITLYVDGVSVGTGTDTNNYAAASGTWYIARNDLGASNFLNGYLSNLRIVKGTAVYTSSFTPSTTPLTAISGTSLLTCQSNRFVDNSASPVTITSTATSVQRFNPFGIATAYSTSVIGGSGYFDGSGDTLQATAGAVPAIGTGNFTLSGWWYLNELKNYQIFFDFRNGTNVEAVPYLYMGSTGLADYFLNGSSNNLSINFRANEWSYVVVSRVSGTTKIFINGAQALSISDSTNYVAGRLNLGFNNSGGTAYYYNGYIADFKLVIGTGTTSGTPTTAPATATSGTQALLSMTNGAIFDNAMMNNLETVGNAQISTSVVKYGTGSLYFDGTGDALIGQNTPNISLSGNFTIEAWVYQTNAGQNAPQLCIGDAANSGGILLYISTGQQLSYFINGGSGASGTATINTWHHIAVVRSGSTITTYLNGVAQNIVTTSTTFSGVPYFGAGLYSSVLYYGAGYMDEVRITKGYARYTVDFTPPTAAFSNIGPT